MESDNSAEKKLFLLDAYALIYLYNFSFIRNPLNTYKELNTSAILAFVTSLEQVLASESPTHIAVAFDVHGDTFRHEMFPEYKANRESMPEDIRSAIPYIRKIIEAYNIPIVEKLGYEADDVIGTLAEKADKEGFTTYMMTPDKDYAQLVGGNRFIYKPAKNGGKPEVWGVQQVNENFETQNPEQVIDILGLMGDASDNVPGCPGRGPKTAMKLISDYGSIDGVYANIDKLKGKMKENLETFKDQVLLSRKLIVIDRNVPIDIDFEKMKIQGVNEKALFDLYNELEFRTLASKIQAPKSEVKPAQQPTLFDMFEVETVKLASSFETIETVKHTYYKIETAEQRASLRAELSIAESFCFDTETTGLDPHSSELVCMSFSICDHEAYCVLLPQKRSEIEKIVLEF